VYDPDSGKDIVFNYGIFDFNSDNFIYRFAKGKTDYKLVASYFEHFFAEYSMRGSGIVEQELNLTPAERTRLWNALMVNLRPENAIYRYNFFFDNCATRPAKIIEDIIEGEIIYGPEPEAQTFRERINYCMRNKPWLIFGCDLALGSPTDRVMTFRETFFLPLLLEEAFDGATIIAPDGAGRQLTAAKNILSEEVPMPVKPTIFTPLFAALVCLALCLALTGMEWRRKTYYAAVDYILFTLAGLAGTVLFFIAFVSEHPAVWPNWQIVWLHPLHLALVAILAVKGLKKTTYYYHFINFATLSLMLAGSQLIPQHFNAAFFPLIICLWMRSGRSILFRYNKA
jgi:hypothetical protein